MTDVNVEPFLTSAVRSAIALHMMEDETVECCGLVTLSNGEYEYVPHENVHPDSGKIDPTTGLVQDVFKFSPKVAASITSAKSRVAAYVHSHPRGPVWPSKADMITQKKVGKPAVIVARTKDKVIDIFSHGDHLLDAPLIGRKFRWSVFDCKEAIRSWVWQNEQYLIDSYPRSMDWFLEKDKTKNENMYEKNFEEQGYKEFVADVENSGSALHPAVGDILLMQLDAPVTNHAAIYVGDNLIYHHRIGKSSGTTSLGYLMGTGAVRKWLRRADRL